MIRLHTQLPLYLAAVACLLALAPGANAQPPSTPYGESNAFVLNTNRIGSGDSEVVILVNAPDNDLTVATGLRRATPNPFNPRTVISFTVASAGRVELGIFDLRCRCVRRLASEGLQAGQHTRVWDGRTDAGEAAPAGVYLVRLSSGDAIHSQKITLVK